jgi:DNA polymerase-3 subunit alpha
LEFSKDPQIPGFINEIHKTGSIEIMPPDINNSDVGFVADYEEERIFWSISKIKHVGISAVQEILDKRKEGDFTSMEDFLNRIEKKKVNKRAVTNMILAGCFDMMYKVDRHSDRKQVLQELYDIRKEKEKDYVEWFDSKGTKHEWFWTLKQHEVSGLGDMSYKKALSFSDHLGSRVSGYVEPEEFYSEDSISKSVVIGGIITEVKEKKIKKGMMGTITLDCNSEPITIRVWPDRWESKNSNDEVMRQVITKSKGRILFISGKVCGPSQWNADNIMQSISEGRSATKWDVL